MAPTPPSLSYGVFYFQAGAKYRNLHTFTMNVSGGPSTIVVDPGTVPFGPPTAGPFGVGTETRFDGVCPDNWTYNNGQLSAVCSPGAISARSLRNMFVATQPSLLGPFPELGRLSSRMTGIAVMD
jgi:hypothetical protein